MRALKFRGKTKDGEWTYGDVSHDYSFTVSGDVISCAILSGNDYVEVDPETVGQLTGLLDSQGREIYEGDRVKAVYQASVALDKQITGTVVWSESHCGWGIESDSIIYRMSATTSQREVIGNIYENPELLK